MDNSTYRRIDAPFQPPGHSAVGQPRQFYIDCTKTYFFGGGTGIQRVVSECAAHARAAGEELGVRCVPVVWVGVGFLEIGANRLAAPHLPRRICTGLRRILLSLRKACRRPSRERTVATTRDSHTAGKPRHTHRATALAAGMMYFVLSWLALPGSWLRFRLPRIQSGDVLVLPDANWGNLIPTGVLERIRQRGAQLACVMHDILPVRLPETFEPELVSRFENWLKWACRHVDAMVCVSRSTRNDLQHYFAEQRISAPPALGTFHLGCNPGLDKSGPRPQIVQELDLISRSRWLLCVGTLEPRKNHDVLLDACDRLWESGRPFGLVFVGKIGWRSESLMNRIRQHPRLHQWLHVYHDLSDSELDLAYDSAAGVVMPSLAEGLGLPVIEALTHHKPVIASDIPPHRETGHNHCLFFDPHDPRALEKRIVELLDGPRHRFTSASFDNLHLPDWKTSVCELLAEVDRVLPREQDVSGQVHKPPLMPAAFARRRQNIATSIR